MATIIDDAGLPARKQGRGYMADQAYFTRFTIILALFILFGFAQFSMRGFVDVRKAPLLTHLHGALMVAWLGLSVAQNMTAQSGRIDQHRKLGWISAALVGGILVTGIAVGYAATLGNRAPPFFSPPYFLALTTLEPIGFAALVAWGVSLRRKTQWHRRIMLGAMIVILEPALGRLLPMPLLGGWGEWIIMALQLMVIVTLATHDRAVLGRVHPATLCVAAVVALIHSSISVLSRIPPFVTYAEALAAA
jgi:uncharacterized membrane protein YozB (DUF420 family)